MQTAESMKNQMRDPRTVRLEEAAKQLAAENQAINDETFKKVEELFLGLGEKLSKLQNPTGEDVDRYIKEQNLEYLKWRTRWINMHRSAKLTPNATAFLKTVALAEENVLSGAKFIEGAPDGTPKEDGGLRVAK